MDPYLEGSLWTSVHAALSVEIARQLAPRLRPKYVARVEKRFVVATPELDEGLSVSLTPGRQSADTYPDIGIATASATPPQSTGGSSGAIVAAAPLHMATVLVEPEPHPWVEIRDVANRQLVADIEILSPTNKRGDGHDEYLQRRTRLLRSTAHLMEIDLLRTGEPVHILDRRDRRRRALRADGP